MKTEYLGSDFDDFLQAEGLLVDVEAAALKRVLTYRIAQLMAERNMSKTELAKRMKTNATTLNRVLDPGNPSITLETLERVANAFGKKLRVEFA